MLRARNRFGQSATLTGFMRSQTDGAWPVIVSAQAGTEGSHKTMKRSGPIARTGAIGLSMHKAKGALTALMLATLGLGLVGALVPDAFGQTAAAPVTEAAPTAAAAPAADATPPAAATPEAAPAEAAPTEAAAEGPDLTPVGEPSVDKADTGWMMLSSLLVLLMIIPGLALFYGGLVRTKNMLSMLMGVSTVAAIGMVMWVVIGYSLAFTTGTNDAFLGGFDRVLLKGVDPSSMVATFSTGVMIPEYTFIVFQMTFACITAALVLGATAERMKFGAVVVFAILWPLICYYPIAHMVWWWPGPDGVAGASMIGESFTNGLIWGFGALDFAGGTVVHINAGVAALVGCLILGPRAGFRKENMSPHSLTLTLVGAGLLWVGWFGFNAGSNLESNGYAALAMMNTFIATAAAGLSWILVEWVTRKQPSMLGLASGLVAGLVAVTPAAGFAGPVGAMILGLIVSPICIFFVTVVKNALKYDDSLDAFGIHAIGGIVGAIGTGFLVNPALGGAGVVDYVNCHANGAVLATCPVAAYDMVTQVTAQLKAVGVTIAWTTIGSAIVFFLIKFTIGLKVKPEVEEEGLDLGELGERAYHN
jgi:ammonium transporter, Amt family